MWCSEEVIKVMLNIYKKVGQVHYGCEQALYHKTRSPGKHRTPHNSDLCQACKDGVCAERRSEYLTLHSTITIIRTYQILSNTTEAHEK